MAPLGSSARAAERAFILGTLAALLAVVVLLQLRARGARDAAASAPFPGPWDTIILQDGFESDSLGQWHQIPDTGRYRITTEPSRVHSGTHALEVLFTPTRGYGMITRWFMPGCDEVYVRFYVMFEEGFENLRGDGNGMHFFVLAGNRIDDPRSSFGKPGVVPSGADFFYAGLDPEYVQRDPTLRPFSFYTYWPDMVGPYGTVTTQAPPQIPLAGGQWQGIVFHVKLNTPGEANGNQTVWIDGAKKLDQRHMRWRTTPDLLLNNIRFDNYMPGGRKTQHLWVDDVTAWRPSSNAR